MRINWFHKSFYYTQFYTWSMYVLAIKCSILYILHWTWLLISEILTNIINLSQVHVQPTPVGLTSLQPHRFLATVQSCFDEHAESHRELVAAGIHYSICHLLVSISLSFTLRLNSSKLNNKAFVTFRFECHTMLICQLFCWISLNPLLEKKLNNLFYLVPRRKKCMLAEFFWRTPLLWSPVTVFQSAVTCFQVEL